MQLTLQDWRLAGNNADMLVVQGRIKMPCTLAQSSCLLSRLCCVASMAFLLKLRSLRGDGKSSENEAHPHALANATGQQHHANAAIDYPLCLHHLSYTGLMCCQVQSHSRLQAAVIPEQAPQLLACRCRLCTFYNSVPTGFAGLSFGLCSLPGVLPRHNHHVTHSLAVYSRRCSRICK